MQLSIVNFELDYKTIVDSIYGGESGVSNYSAVINDCSMHVSVTPRFPNIKIF